MGAQESSQSRSQSVAPSPRRTALNGDEADLVIRLSYGNWSHKTGEPVPLKLAGKVSRADWTQFLLELNSSAEDLIVAEGVEAKTEAWCIALVLIGFTLAVLASYIFAPLAPVIFGCTFCVSGYSILYAGPRQANLARPKLLEKLKALMEKWSAVVFNRYHMSVESESISTGGGGPGGSSSRTIFNVRITTKPPSAAVDSDGRQITAHVTDEEATPTVSTTAQPGEIIQVQVQPPLPLGTSLDSGADLEAGQLLVANIPQGVSGGERVIVQAPDGRQVTCGVPRPVGETLQVQFPAFEEDAPGLASAADVVTPVTIVEVPTTDKDEHGNITQVVGMENPSSRSISLCQKLEPKPASMVVLQGVPRL